MAKWAEVEHIEQAVRDMEQTIAMLREVNAAQAEQLRKAQERIRAAEAERDRAWNEAIEAAARLTQGEPLPGSDHYTCWPTVIAGNRSNDSEVVAMAHRLALAIRSLAKEAGE